MQAPIIHTFEQGSPEWFEAHIGKPTASQFGQFMTTSFELRKGEMLRTYVASKVAEAWRKQPLPQFGSWATDQGLILEEEVKPWYELEYDCEIKRVGFIESPDHRVGCSPDGLLGDDSGIEIKSPQSVSHVKWLLDGGVPNEYICQVHGSLYVTGRKEWVFCSYRRGFPKLVITVKRDEEIMEKIAAALAAFYQAFGSAMERLKQYEK